MAQGDSSVALSDGLENLCVKGDMSDLVTHPDSYNVCYQIWVADGSFCLRTERLISPFAGLLKQPRLAGSDLVSLSNSQSPRYLSRPSRLINTDCTNCCNNHYRTELHHKGSK